MRSQVVLVLIILMLSQVFTHIPARVQSFNSENRNTRVTDFSFYSSFSDKDKKNFVVRARSEGKIGNSEINFTYSGWSEDERVKLSSFLLLAYPEIKAVYGKPAFNITVDIMKSAHVRGGRYEAADNRIYLSDLDRYTLIHEVIHAFHDDLVAEFTEWYEEGFASAVTAIVWYRMTGDESYIQRSLLYYEAWNMPALDPGNWFSTGPPVFMRYLVACGAWLKVYYEYPNFFLNFNELYYKLDYAPSTEDLVSLFSKVAPYVEGQPFIEWHERQYVIYARFQIGSFIYPVIENMSAGELSLRVFYFTRPIAHRDVVPQSGNVTLNFYDSNNNLITKKNVFVDQSGESSSFKVNLPKISGRVKVVAEAGSGLNYVAETLYVYLGDTNGLFGVIVGDESGNISFKYKNTTLSTSVINGAFNVPEAVNWEGLIEITYTGQKGFPLKRYVSKSFGNYFVIFNILPDISIENIPKKEWFTPLIPEPGDSVLINISVRNIGLTDALNFIVEFYDGFPSDGKKLKAILVDRLQAGNSVPLYIAWKSSPGKHHIFVVADLQGEIAEYSDTNNMAHRLIVVPEKRSVLLWELPGLCFMSLLSGDINGDGTNEIIVANASFVTALSYDGAILWQVKIREFATPPLGNPKILLEDIDEDLLNEVIVAPVDGKEVYVIDGNGTIIQSYYYNALVSVIAVDDVNGDGKKEVIIGGYGSHEYFKGERLKVFSKNGSLLWYSNQTGIWDDLTLGDIDGDGTNEIVAACRISCLGSKILVYKGDGSCIWKFEGIYGCYSIIIAELDGDNKKEVVGRWDWKARCPLSYSICALDDDGSLLWKVESPIPLASMPEKLLIYDLDRNNISDIIAGGICAIRGSDGRVLWVNNPENYISIRGTPEGTSEIIADINGDGISDTAIITRTRILAFSGSDGSLILAYTSTEGALRAVSLVDLNRDGFMEIVALYRYGGVIAIGDAARCVKVTFDSSPRAGYIVIDSMNVSSSMLPKSFLWTNSSIHTIYVPYTVFKDVTTRYILDSYTSDGKTTKISRAESGVYSISVIINASHIMTFNYILQYYLMMQTNYGTIAPSSGWYDAGTTVQISATAPVAAKGERYAWKGWTGAGTGSYSGTDNPVTIIVNASIKQTAYWIHQFYLRVVSDYGNIRGEGWYDEGSIAEFSVTETTIGLLVRQVFTGWNGDSNASTPIATILMNSPKTVMAKWKPDYTQLYLFLALIAVVMIGIFIIVMRKKPSQVPFIWIT
ncbi:MAG: VCBS repeat-containing protein [Candidatus Brockarchaeota archaeon]|nr:VCBS repeat-containing protein [Candidatus Brockarchaeota archaeon]